MAGGALVRNRNVALDIAQLAMACDAREMPLLATGGAQFVAETCAVTGTIVDAITGTEQDMSAIGLAAFAVEAGRMKCIVAPLDDEPAAWFAADLVELAVEITEYGGLRRKARTIAIAFGDVRIVVADVARVLRSVMQTGQAEALVAALSERSTTLSRPGPGPATVPGAVPVAAAAVAVGAHRICVELGEPDRPRRSALWDRDASTDRRREALSSFISGLVDSGYADRFIVEAFLEPVLTAETADGSPQADVWATERAASPSSARGRILPPAAVSLAHPRAALDIVARSDHSLALWLRPLRELVEDEPLASAAARRFRYEYRARGDVGTSFSGLTFGEQRLDGVLTSTGRGLVASFRTSSTSSSDRAWVIVVPAASIFGIRFRAIHPVKANRFSRASETTARLIGERGYGELLGVEVVVESDDGWRPVRLLCTLEPKDGEDALLRDVEAMVATLPSVDTAFPAQWSAFTPLSIGGDGFRQLDVRFVDPVPLSVARSALRGATPSDVATKPSADVPVSGDLPEPVADKPVVAPFDPPARAYDAPFAPPDRVQPLPAPAEPPDRPPPPGRNRRGAWIIGGVAAISVAIVIALIVRAAGSSEDADAPSTAVTAAATVLAAPSATAAPRTTATSSPIRERPAEWPSPTPALAADISQFMAGVGRPIPTVVGLIGALADGPQDADACRTAAAELDASATPEEFRDVIAATPDPVLGGLLAGLMRVTGDAISACVNEVSGAAESFDPVRETLAYVQMREDELGVG